MKLMDTEAKEKLLVLASLWTTFASAFLFVITTNYR